MHYAKHGVAIVETALEMALADCEARHDDQRRQKECKRRGIGFAAFAKYFRETLASTVETLLLRALQFESRASDGLNAMRPGGQRQRNGKPSFDDLVRMSGVTHGD